VKQKVASDALLALPCPFCGEPAKPFVVKGWNKVRCVSVSCVVRPCTRGCHGADFAIELWNRRANTPTRAKEER